jgi:hypothetical protein
MPSAWEFHRDLNTSDPKDAWSDPDQDGVCNLFEYMLGTHPQDPSQPTFLRYDGRQPLDVFIRNAPRGVVLQIPEGQYELNYLHDIQDRVPRLMIQGGWNSDFSERDICLYPTTLDGTGQGPVFDYSISVDNSAALILDGFKIQNGKGEAVRFKSFRNKVQLAIANSQIINHEVAPQEAVITFEDGPFTIISDFVLVNSLVAGNKGTAIQVNQFAAHTNLKILHCLVTDNHFSSSDPGGVFSGYGIHLQPEADSALHLQIVNSVIWGNENASVFLNNQGQNPLEVDSHHNIYGQIERVPATAVFQSASDRFTDPNLLITGLDYQFASSSPTWQTGVDIGYFSAIYPDLGPTFCTVVPTATITGRTDKPLVNIFPNPASETLYLQFLSPKMDSGYLRLYSLEGQLIWHQNFSSILLPHHYLSVGSLPSGQYLLMIKQGNTRQSFPIIRH